MRGTNECGGGGVGTPDLAEEVPLPLLQPSFLVFVNPAGGGGDLRGRLNLAGKTGVLGGGKGRGEIAKMQKAEFFKRWETDDFYFLKIQYNLVWLESKKIRNQPCSHVSVYQNVSI